MAAVASNRPKSPVRNPPSVKRRRRPLRRRSRTTRRRLATCTRPPPGRALLRHATSTVTPGSGRPTVPPPRSVRRVVVGDAAGFAGAVERVNLDAERASERADGGRLERRPGAHQRVAARAATRRAAVLVEVVEHERHARKHARAVGRRVGDELLRHERLAQHDRRALQQQRHHQVAEPVRVREREIAASDSRPGWMSIAVDDVRAVGDELRLGRERRLGQAGRSRGQLQHRRAAIDVGRGLDAGNRHGDEAVVDTGGEVRGGTETIDVRGRARHDRGRRAEALRERAHFSGGRARVHRHQRDAERPRCEPERERRRAIAGRRDDEVIRSQTFGVEGGARSKRRVPEIVRRQAAARRRNVHQRPRRLIASDSFEPFDDFAQGALPGSDPALVLTSYGLNSCGRIRIGVRPRYGPGSKSILKRLMDPSISFHINRRCASSRRLRSSCRANARPADGALPHPTSTSTVIFRAIRSCRQ